jgi:hypothetical protein
MLVCGLAYFSTLKEEAKWFSKTLVDFQCIMWHLYCRRQTCQELQHSKIDPLNGADLRLSSDGIQNFPDVQVSLYRYIS